MITLRLLGLTAAGISLFMLLTSGAVLFWFGLLGGGILLVADVEDL